MSYDKRTDIPCEPGELVVELKDPADPTASGPLVAVQCPATRNPQSNNLVFSPRARWIDASGAQQTDAAGAAVITSCTFNATAEKLAALSADTISRECLLLVLGEALTADPSVPEVNLLRLGGNDVAQRSIRNAIAAASAVAPAASEVL